MVLRNSQIRVMWSDADLWVRNVPCEVTLTLTLPPPNCSRFILESNWLFQLWRKFTPCILEMNESESGRLRTERCWIEAEPAQRWNRSSHPIGAPCTSGGPQDRSCFLSTDVSLCAHHSAKRFYFRLQLWMYLLASWRCFSPICCLATEMITFTHKSISVQSFPGHHAAHVCLLRSTPLF